MSHPKDHEAWPPDTIVRWKKTGQFVRIVERAFLKDGKGFLHYHGHIEGRVYEDRQFHAFYHDDLELEALPPGITSWPPEK